MNALLLAVDWLTNDMWYALPLVIAVSLVYAATRHEQLRPIYRHALRVGLWIIGVMLVISVLLPLISWWQV